MCFIRASFICINLFSTVYIYSYISVWVYVTSLCSINITLLRILFFISTTMRYIIYRQQERCGNIESGHRGHYVCDRDRCARPSTIYRSYIDGGPRASNETQSEINVTPIFQRWNVINCTVIHLSRATLTTIYLSFFFFFECVTLNSNFRIRPRSV